MEYTNTIAYLNDYKEKALNRTKSFLKTKKKDSVANSLKSNITFTNNSISITLTSSEGGKWVNIGRKPNSKRPPMKSIESWIKRKGITPYNKMTIKSLAYVIARSIGIKGIKAIKFVSYYMKQYKNPIFKQGLDKAMKLDTTNNIKKEIKKQK